MAVSLRMLLRILLAALIVVSLAILWYYTFQVPFCDNASLMVDFSGADISAYQRDAALAFFSSINSSEHQNCRFYRERFPIKRDRDGDMDVAVTIAVENDVRPVARILRMVHRTNNYYCIHLNRNADPLLQEAMQGLLVCFDGNVELVPKNSSIAVTSTGVGVLKAHLACAEQALNHNTKWKYLINIDDDEFPLRTNLEIVAILQALNGSNLVEAFSTEGNNSLPLDAVWYNGALHGAYRREFLEEALLGQFVAPPRQYLFNNQALMNPEQVFFPTLAYNAKLNLSGACQTATSPDSEVNLSFLAELRIRDKYGVRCTTKYVDHVCLLGDEHLQMIKAVSHLFASKFQADLSQRPTQTSSSGIFIELTCTKQHI
ncbi:N-acetyllactosaminide beta-16-N-acetylglucosaminyl-transferase [Taenia crassiceps]|uniref:N-acetyllactosaminide beta-16-N-acetylglucosaminyl-transferase n=1 Tax=Taenia crassiceps TaxID=6207 RepID=A0ABR4Q2E5_9CEST